MIVVGMDPSLSNWGFALAELDMETLQPRLLEIYTQKTEPGKDRKRVRKNSDDLIRARLLHEAVKKYSSRASIAFVEVPHGSQSARSMASYGVCIGVLAGVGIPLIQLTEQELKLATTGKKTSTKSEMIEWVVQRHSEVKWAMHKGRPAGSNEHMADAVGAIYAGIKTDDFRSALAMLKFIKGAA